MSGALHHDYTTAHNHPPMEPAKGFRAQGQDVTTHGPALPEAHGLAAGVLTLLKVAKRVCQRYQDDGEDWLRAWSDFNHQLCGIKVALVFSQNYELAEWVCSLEDSWQEWRPTNA